MNYPYSALVVTSRPLGEDDDDEGPSCNNIHQLMPNKDIIILASAFLLRRGHVSLSSPSKMAKGYNAGYTSSRVLYRLVAAVTDGDDDDDDDA